ncbi:MAG: glycosyltransferase family 2 protein [Anaerolineaceae bacterium]|nr:glycosyltransferase family 2 protein [Anaerolineaceae bacterium]MCB9100228.1 glycosyltransferase family 2 protein [Anaerolineales bacterium]
MTDSPKVAVIIPNWNTQRWLPGCLDALNTQTFRDFQIIVVDNGSTDDSVAFIRDNYPDVRVITLPENRGFAVAVNTGIKATQSDYIALLNVDTVPRPGWLASLVETADQSSPDIGFLASKMLNLDQPDLIDDAGDSFSWYASSWKRGKGESAAHYNEPGEVFSACAGAALYRRRFFEKVGLFDEDFNSYLEDIDLGLRGRLLGYRCWYVPAAEVLHQGQGAGIPRPRYVTFSTCNRLTILIKNIPLALLVKHSYTLLFGQFYFLLVYKKPYYSAKGYAAFLRKLPLTIQKRRAILGQKKISNQTLDRLLTNDLNEPSLRTIFLTKLR